MSIWVSEEGIVISVKSETVRYIVTAPVIYIPPVEFQELVESMPKCIEETPDTSLWASLCFTCLLLSCIISITKSLCLKKSMIIKKESAVCPSWGGQPAESQCELRRSGPEEAACQSPAAAAGAEQAGGGVSELSCRPEGTLLYCLQTIRHQSEQEHAHGRGFTLEILRAHHLPAASAPSVLCAASWQLSRFSWRSEAGYFCCCIYHPPAWLVIFCQGENVPRELQALVKDLPAVLEEVGKDAVKLEEHIKLYTAFTNFVCEWWV